MLVLMGHSEHLFTAVQGPQEGSLQEVLVGRQPQAISIQVEEAEVAAFCTLYSCQHFNKNQRTVWQLSWV